MNLCMCWPTTSDTPSVTWNCDTRKNMKKINYVLISALLLCVLIYSSSAEQKRTRNRGSATSTKRKLPADAPLPKKSSGKIGCVWVVGLCVVEIISCSDPTTSIKSSASSVNNEHSMNDEKSKWRDNKVFLCVSVIRRIDVEIGQRPAIAQLLNCRKLNWNDDDVVHIICDWLDVTQQIQRPFRFRNIENVISSDAVFFDFCCCDRNKQFQRQPLTQSVVYSIFIISQHATISPS